MIGMTLCGAVLLWLGAMCMTFADPFSGVVMAFLGLGIICLALRMGGFFGHSKLV